MECSRERRGKKKKNPRPPKCFALPAVNSSVYAPGIGPCVRICGYQYLEIKSSHMGITIPSERGGVPEADKTALFNFARLPRVFWDLFYATLSAPHPSCSQPEKQSTSKRSCNDMRKTHTRMARHAGNSFHKTCTNLNRMFASQPREKLEMCCLSSRFLLRNVPKHVYCTLFLRRAMTPGQEDKNSFLPELFNILSCETPHRSHVSKCSPWFTPLHRGQAKQLNSPAICW